MEERERGRMGERELYETAIKSFEKNLEYFRQFYPVKTICMHGSPMSKWDSRLLWKYYDYKDFGIIGEPYFDIDFDEVLYLTDTGRRWDGEAVSVRDKAGSGEQGAKKYNPFCDWKVKPIKYRQSHISPSPLLPLTPPSPSFHSTFDIINAANEDKLPERIMMTFHPQRWTDKPFPWLKELVWQNVKNVGKYFWIKMLKQ